jgi:hypothetical protein
LILITKTQSLPKLDELHWSVMLAVGQSEVAMIAALPQQYIQTQQLRTPIQLRQELASGSILEDSNIGQQKWHYRETRKTQQT